MTRRAATLIVLALVATVIGLGVTGSSSATFVSASQNVSTVTAASDWTPPTVAITSPGAAVRETVTVRATATDARSGVASVRIETRRAGGAWTLLCTATAAPYSCSWKTAAGADGAVDLRATATDRAGNTATSEVVRTTVINTAGVSLVDPGDVVRGAVALSAAISPATDLGWKVSVQAASTGTNTWTTLAGCSNLSAPFGCTWSTPGTASGRYDLRAVATSGTHTLTSPRVVDVHVDNTAPTATFTVPAETLKGSVTLSGKYADAHTGVAKVVYQVATSATGSYSEACTASAAPFSCSLATATLAYGNHFFRAVATDVAGNTTTSAVVGPRLVDNTTRSISLADPGAVLEGTVTLVATPAASAGIASVVIERANAGSSKFTPICTRTAAPWACAWNTPAGSDGSYDLRAQVTDVNGQSATSAIVAARRVDNTTTAFRGTDITSTNGGRSGFIDNGDTLVYTFSRRVDLTTVTAGWDGTAIEVSLNLTDAGLISGDHLAVSRPGAAVNLGRVGSNRNYLPGLGRTATLSATMTAETVTGTDGRSHTVITVRVGDLLSGELRTPDLSTTLTWATSTAVRSLGGVALPDTEVRSSQAGRGKDF
ncbi:hypothetical protein KG112_09755 [Nocardioides sp. zg-ZUI104]|uniref:Ig-like domain-containing protein n=1 Tax=Nocardioides faecalis TaxID=2803858 RepID=UPI001BCFE5C2|nr:Ig-like domain-containing protein [Nocardioides faecalis]MBS4753085.1 hypothetical protein [Nocardioides faecalis]